MKTNGKSIVLICSIIISIFLISAGEKNIRLAMIGNMNSRGLLFSWTLQSQENQFQDLLLFKI